MNRRTLFKTIAGAGAVLALGKAPLPEPRLIYTNLEGTKTQDLGPARNYAITPREIGIMYRLNNGEWKSL